MNFHHVSRYALIASAILAIGLSSPPALAAGQPASRASLASAAAATVITKTYSVIVNADGTLAVGPAGASSNNFGGNYGYFEVIFPSDVSKCVYTATLGDASPTFPALGFISVTLRSGNPNGVFVRTADTNGTANDHAFHLHVQC
ncbi:hypothetical protein DK842_14840 [Chromobacterium phragmitis]|uniref:hypothetical protein n=1 Tax=Chromobacterium phragmitis TaxID=2202141 RepID=UPI000DEC681C|nr:hypothetical protein [Chromobacterium phragmitis]AXE31055.1 hypothetical protein DK842_14840 [Chromobacterium phragmitis]